MARSTGVVRHVGARAVPFGACGASMVYVQEHGSFHMAIDVGRNGCQYLLLVSDQYK